MTTAPSETSFTVRQQTVLEELRRGKSNKAIAVDLGMSINTVKVHVRTLMKRVGARNRTEIAYLTRD